VASEQSSRAKQRVRPDEGESRIDDRRDRRIQTDPSLPLARARTGLESRSDPAQVLPVRAEDACELLIGGHRWEV
jgi:hypothetical protein